MDDKAQIRLLNDAIEAYMNGEILEAKDIAIEFINNITDSETDKLTNGDVIKTLFPNDSRCFLVVNMDRNDWWNAPYKVERSE